MDFMKRFLLLAVVGCSLINFAVGVEVLINTKGEKNEASEPFIPTKEWQVVKEGQAIPKGLHIRSNLQTGVTEAKLMDGKPSKNTGAIVIKEDEKKTMAMGIKQASPQQQERPKDKVESGPAERLREQIIAAMKDLNKKDEIKDPKILKKAKDAKFRSYEELKKDFEKINMKIRTDMEIIKELMTKVNSTNATVDSKISALTDLEYYLHQIDNARDFTDNRGLELLLQEMKHPNWRVRSEANFAISSALSSNVKVQIRALELGVLQTLLHQLQTEREGACLNRVLFALSALLRNFPYAQLRFVQSGGLRTVGALYRDAERATERLHVRTITMLTDFLTEKASHEATFNLTDPMHVEKERQYKQVSLEKHLRQEGWCALVPPLLTRVSSHDGVEKVLKFLLAAAKFCPLANLTDPPVVQLQGHLMKLNTEYVTLAAEEAAEGESNGYFSGLQTLVRRVLESTGHVRANDEL